MPTSVLETTAGAKRHRANTKKSRLMVEAAGRKSFAPE
jgi:hypothetical protein